jgi:exodeoxyribonuclease VII large subunit
VAASAAPVIAGVGHETDFTIVDFACDLRAPTPTAAAELATPDRVDLLAHLSGLRGSLARAMQMVLSNNRWEWGRLENRLRQQSPLSRVRTDRQRLDELARRMSVAVDHSRQLQRTRLVGLELRLAALNPSAVLARGFAVVSTPEGILVRSVDQVSGGDRLNIRVSDGSFGAAVTGESHPVETGAGSDGGVPEGPAGMA